MFAGSFLAKLAKRFSAGTAKLYLGQLPPAFFAGFEAQESLREHGDVRCFRQHGIRSRRLRRGEVKGYV